MNKFPFYFHLSLSSARYIRWVSQSHNKFVYPSFDRSTFFQFSFEFEFYLKDISQQSFGVFCSSFSCFWLVVLVWPYKSGSQSRTQKIPQSLFGFMKFCKIPDSDEISGGLKKKSFIFEKRAEKFMRMSTNFQSNFPQFYPSTEEEYTSYQNFLVNVTLFFHMGIVGA